MTDAARGSNRRQTPAHCARHLRALEAWWGASLPAALKEVIALHGGSLVGDRVHLYAADELIERNACFETPTYCPGYVVIGDDSGGRAVVVHAQLQPPSVFMVDHGSMSESEFEIVSDSLFTWIDDGCPLE